MPVYTVAGVEVDFPFDAYPVQLAYMEKVVLALEHGRNALLESPTGTGKTLSLLCAALGWRRAHAERLRSGDPAPAAAVAVADEVWARSVQAAAAGDGGAPPGGGAVAARTPRIVYASRTHSQLQQVVRELRRTVHRPRICVLGSREQMCIHADVRGLRGGAQQNGACQALVAAQGCCYHQKLKVLKQREGTVAHPDADVAEGERKLPDIEDFVAIAQQRELCPFYYARELQHSAEVLFVPYNYLIDPNARRALNIDLASDVLIFDEAHNIEKARPPSARDPAQCGAPPRLSDAPPRPPRRAPRRPPSTCALPTSPAASARRRSA